MNLKRWIDDWRWALLMRRIRIERRQIYFSQRIKFDEDLRPKIKDEIGYVIYYPDAIYYVKNEDFVRAKSPNKGMQR